MEISDRVFVTNKDWDPNYLRHIVSQDFYEFKDLWQTSMGDGDLVDAVDKIEKYCPEVEDISLDDSTLYEAVTQIENELAQPDSTQFFQFDSQGNMFMFAPGAGCTGEAKLVRPGDELIFSSTYEWDRWQGPSMSFGTATDESNLASTCPAAVHEPSRQFKAPITDAVLDDLSHKNFSPKTLKKVRWAMKMYHDWRAFREVSGLERIACDLDDKATINQWSLWYALCRFITEVKKVNGDDFPGKILYEIIVCIQFHLESLGYSFKLIKDEAFRDLKYNLDNTMKARTASGIGVSIKQVETLTVTDEDYLWSLGFLGTSNPDQLLNMVVFCIGKGFALRAVQEHKALQSIPFNSQFKFMRDGEGEIYLRYTEDIGLKTNKGGLRDRKVTPKTIDLYATSNAECCPLCAIVKYLSLLPKSHSCQSFYLQPQKKFFAKSWYVNKAAGINLLCNVVRDLCHDAGLPGYYTNHSLRSTAATKMYQHDLDEQLIQEITGHLSLAVHAYKRTSDRQRKLASNTIFSR